MEDEQQLPFNEEQFIEILYVDEDVFDNLSLIQHIGATTQNDKNKSTEIPKELVEQRTSNAGGVGNKLKRRSNLTEFQDDLPIKRKNESAKRELTSIVTQLGKIDKQLNASGEEPRVAINFVATFTSFKSNRVSTFKYPLDAEVTKTYLEYEAIIAAVKNAVKEAVGGIPNQTKSSEPETGVESPSVTAAESLMTPTKIISAFTALPSPVSVRGQPVSSKNLCAKNSCTFGKKLRKHVWIKCCHQSVEGQSCSVWVHASCLGFPNLKEEDVKLLDGWIIQKHKSSGRNFISFYCNCSRVAFV